MVKGKLVLASGAAAFVALIVDDRRQSRYRLITDGALDSLDAAVDTSESAAVPEKSARGTAPLAPRLRTHPAIPHSPNAIPGHAASTTEEARDLADFLKVASDKTMYPREETRRRRMERAEREAVQSVDLGSPSAPRVFRAVTRHAGILWNDTLGKMSRAGSAVRRSIVDLAENGLKR